MTASTRRDPQAGFTLIEALVAMAILATSAVTLLAAVEAHTARITDLEERTAARWVAENHLAALRLGLPAPDRRIAMLGREWWVETERRPTSDDALTELRIEAGPDAPAERQPVVELTGFVAGEDQ